MYCLCAPVSERVKESTYASARLFYSFATQAEYVLQWDPLNMFACTITKRPRNIHLIQL